MGVRELVLERAQKEGLEKGISKGIAQGKHWLSKNLLQTGKFTISEIADLADVSGTFVQDISKP